MTKDRSTPHTTTVSRRGGSRFGCRSRLRCAVGALSLLLACGDARAEPQGTAGLTIGVAGAGLDRSYWDETDFHLGLRGDVLFGRERASDFGAGPYVEVLTHAFDDVQFGGGLSVLLPVIEYLPVVVSAGTYGRFSGEPYGTEPGIAAEVFWGSRSYNFHSAYGLSFGLLGEFRYGLGDSRETSIVIAAQLDLVGLSLPFLFLINAARGGSPETAPVK